MIMRRSTVIRSRLSFRSLSCSGFSPLSAIVAWLAYGRARGSLTLFCCDYYSSLVGNLGWHVFVLTGIIFIGCIFFSSIVEMVILRFNAPIFASSCAIPSQRDVAHFVWDAVAQGAFKFRKYLPLSSDGCTPDKSGWTAQATRLLLTAFTSLVLMWYAASFLKAYYSRLGKK